MTKSTLAEGKIRVKNFLKDVQTVCEQPTEKSYRKLILDEYPFDHQLLTMSSIYRTSRILYRKLGGRFSPRVCSTMRGLSTQDLFKDEIDYTPALSELMWFKEHGHAVSDAPEELDSLLRFTEISIFHEQNHRIIWRLLPAAPKSQGDMCRYLNFAESLVVTLDLAMADQVGKKLSPVLERLKVIYRPGGEDLWHTKSPKIYRDYLLAVLCATYYSMEILHEDDILNAVNYVLPGQKKMNAVAVRRGMQLSEIFTRVTNPQWQDIYWQQAQKKLKKIHGKNRQAPLVLPQDPLDLDAEFTIANRIFGIFGL